MTERKGGSERCVPLIMNLPKIIEIFKNIIDILCGEEIILRFYSFNHPSFEQICKFEVVES